MHEFVATNVIMHVAMCVMWCPEGMFLEVAAASCIKNPNTWMLETLQPVSVKL
jgi:hypothetical protein